MVACGDREDFMTQSKELEQISTLVPKSHPPTHRTDRPGHLSGRPIGAPAHPAGRMGLPEPTERPAQPIERHFDPPQPPVGALTPLYHNAPATVVAKA